MAGKFSTATEQFNIDLGALFNRAIRMALLAGLAMAVRTTKHDSSNAAVHWLVAARGKSRPGGRRYGKLRDLRGTATRPGVPPVGKRRDGGKNAALAERFVRNRELSEVIEKLVSGRRPETLFYFYHPLEPGEEYTDNALIEEAGKAALAETLRVMQNRMAAGQARKRPI